MLRNQKDKLTAVLYDSITEPGSLKSFHHESNEIAHTGALTENQGTKSDQAWFGAASVEELNNRLTHGWGEGADKLRTIATKQINPTSVRRRRVRGDQGDELDIHAVYRGDLSRAWTRSHRKSGVGPRSVSIVCNLACPHYVSADKLFWRGASALKLAEELTLAGYNVAMYGATGSENFDGKHSKLAQFIEIKSEDAPLDTSALAAIVAMPGFKRTRFHAGTVEECERRDIEVHYSLGSADQRPIFSGIALLPIPQTAFIQPEDVLDKETAERWIDSVMSSIEEQQLAEAA